MLWEKALCITLPDSTARREGVEALGFPVEFRYGRDCRNTTIEELVREGVYDPERRARYGRAQLTPAEVGCAVSHLAVAREVALSGKTTLILEDDVRLTGQPIPSTAPNFALAYLGYQKMNLATPVSVRLKLAFYYPFILGRSGAETIRRIYARPLDDQWLRAGWFNNAHAYILTPEGAEYIVGLQQPVWLEADTALGHLVRFSGLDAIALEQPAVDQRRDIGSTIGTRESWK